MTDIENKSYQPTVEEMSEFVGNPLFDEICSYMESEYKALFWRQGFDRMEFEVQKSGKDAVHSLSQSWTLSYAVDSGTQGKGKGGDTFDGAFG